MDFKSLMAQIHDDDDDMSVEDLVLMSSPAPDPADDIRQLFEAVPGLKESELRNFMVDYLDTMSFGGVSQAQYDLVEIDNLAPKQLIELAESYGVDTKDFFE